MAQPRDDKERAAQREADEREWLASKEAEDQHCEWLLTALRAASLRAKLMEADLNTIGTALKGRMIGSETAVRWIRDAGLLGMVGALPENVGTIAGGDAQ